jgi:hypothetical protein
MIREDYMAGIILPSAVSQNEKAMQHLLDDQKFSSLVSNAPEIIELFNFPISLTDAQTGKFILANSSHGYLHKGSETLQSPNDLIGLSIDEMDIEHFIPGHILQRTILKIDVDSAAHALLEMKKRLSYDAKMLKSQVESPFISILENGFIYSKILVKQPILSRDKRKVIAFLNCTYDRSLSLNLLEQFQLHRNIYPDKFAIKVLLQYLNIAHYFKAPPTAREMQVLLLMRDNSHRKYIGKQLNISRNTAASHIQHIKELKLIKPDIDEVAIQLRRVPAALSTDQIKKFI